MDPVTAFQTAGCIIGLIDFAARLLSRASEVYTSPDGLGSRTVKLSVISSDLKYASNLVQAAIPQVSSNESDQQLTRLCKQCLDITQHIDEAIEKLRARGTTKLDYAKSCFIIAAKSLFQGNQVQELEKQLEQIRAQIIMVTLLSLWQDGKDAMANMERVLVALENIDRRSRVMASDLQRLVTPHGVERQKGLGDLIETLWDVDWHPASTKLPSSGGLNMQPHIRSQIISSLRFDLMENRDTSIDPAHAKTFNWIFDSRNSEQNVATTCPEMSTWLKAQDDSIYWITGKPGSGKSTLMKHILQHPSLESHLSAWAGSLPHLFAGFYFWNAGSDLQKSKEGLLRTLLYHCLQSRPDLLERVCPRRWIVACTFPDIQQQLPEWKLLEIEESFLSLLSLSGQIFRLAIFVDGLDEFYGCHRELIRWIVDINEKYDIKICVSSRNWPEFSDVLSRGPHLMMEKLTEKDTIAYVADRMYNCGGFRELQPIYPSECETLLDSIVAKGEGVFLWVRLVVTHMIEYLNKRKLQSIRQLQKIVDDLPPEMEALYTHIWNNIDPADVGTAAKLMRLWEAAGFQLEEEAVGCPLEGLTVWLAEGNEIPRRADSALSPDTQEHIIQYIRGALNAHTRGILEISPKGLITILHRSAADWILQETIWNDVCKKTPPGFDPHLALLRADATRLSDRLRERFDYGRSIQSGFWRCVTDYLLHGSFVQGSPENDRILIETLDEFDETATKVANEFSIFRGAWEWINCEFPEELQDWTFIGGLDCSPHHWVISQGRVDETDQNSFVGLAAQLGILPYVQAKVSQNPSLLNKKSPCISLLQNATFGFRFWSLRKAVNIYTHIPPLHEQRLKTIEYLLSCGANPLEKCSMSTYSKTSVHRIVLRNAGQCEYYQEVARLFKQRLRSRWRIFYPILQHSRYRWKFKHGGRTNPSPEPSPSYG